MSFFALPKMTLPLLALMLLCGCQSTVQPTISTGGSNNDVRPVLGEMLEGFSPRGAAIMLYEVKDGREVTAVHAGAPIDGVVPFSAFRPFVIAAAMAAGEGALEKVYDLGDGTLEVNGRVLRDRFGGGKRTLREIAARPTAMATLVVARSLGFQRLREFMAQMGFQRRHHAEDADAIGHGSTLDVSAQELVQGWCRLVQQPQVMQVLKMPTLCSDLRGRYGNRVIIAIGAFPVEKPEYLLMIMVDEPKGGRGIFKSLEDHWEKCRLRVMTGKAPAKD